MVDLQTDEEKAERIKKWWKENGVAVIAGVVIGLAAVFGWRAWSGYQEQIGQQASLAFEELLASVEQLATMPPNSGPEPQDQAASAPPNPLLALAAEQQARLRDDFGGTPYAFLGQLAMARALNDQGDLPAAAQRLREAITSAPDTVLESLAALRLARVLVALGDYPGASALIGRHERSGNFAADFAVLRGDIARAEDRIEDARAAYQQALRGTPASAGLIQLKLLDLPAPSGT